MMRRTVPFFGGGRRNGRAIASSLPRLSEGVACVSHRSVTTTLPVPRLKTCGAGPSRMKTDLPCGLWPVTTRRIGFGIARTRFGKGSFQLDVGGGDHLAPMRGLLREERGGPATPKLQIIASIVAITESRAGQVCRSKRLHAWKLNTRSWKEKRLSRPFAKSSCQHVKLRRIRAARGGLHVLHRGEIALEVCQQRAFGAALQHLAQERAAGFEHLARKKRRGLRERHDLQVVRLAVAGRILGHVGEHHVGRSA